MSNMITELGLLDDENFIYLDKDGNTKKRIELSISWELNLSTKDIVTCYSKYFLFSDSLGYLRYLIGQVMEKYSIFSGLTSLQAEKLMDSNNIILPETGFIGDFVKSGDYLICQLISQDLWLDVKVQAENAAYILFFDIKVNKNSKIHFLKQVLLEFSNQLFAAKKVSHSFSIENSELKKLDVNKKNNILETDIKIVQNQSNDYFTKDYPLVGEELIGENFCYSERYALLKLSGTSDDILRQSEFGVSYALSESFLQFSSSLPLRNLRVEPQLLNRIQYSGTGIIELSELSDPRQKNCRCLVF
ncbi:hypothetical protein SteCoe_14742 [Stentor coeruleus]|uniref:Uncharacterized protein n=1 Tax=Stentor coeruleus TaxID=5963 RepID=A0A1R2C5D1_9CILI|nr:hypothetical protein SteCoe_14742 [Stentor coeruleus]